MNLSEINKTILKLTKILTTPILDYSKEKIERFYVNGFLECHIEKYLKDFNDEEYKTILEGIELLISMDNIDYSFFKSIREEIYALNMSVHKNTIKDFLKEYFRCLKVIGITVSQSYFSSDARAIKLEYIRKEDKYLVFRTEIGKEINIEGDLDDVSRIKDTAYSFHKLVSSFYYYKKFNDSYRKWIKLREVKELLVKY